MNATQQMALMMKQNPISCIFQPDEHKGGLFLGNILAAEDPKIRDQYKIGAVLSICKGYQNIKLPETTKHLGFDLEDEASENLMPSFDQGITFIHTNLEKTNVLVHCMQGISRSASFIIAYLIKYKDYTVANGLRYCQKKRKIVNPNEGFVKQLL